MSDDAPNPSNPSNPYYLESWRAGDVMISRPLLARLMAAIETPEDLEEWEVDDLLGDAEKAYGAP